jgi:hypothetical protein
MAENKSTPPASIPNDAPADVRVIAAVASAVQLVLFALAELLLLFGGGFLFYAGKLTLVEVSPIVGPIIAAIAYGRTKGRTMTAAGLVMLAGSAVGSKIAAMRMLTVLAMCFVALQIGGCAAWQDVKPVVKPVVHSVLDWLLAQCEAKSELDGSDPHACVDALLSAEEKAAAARMSVSSE